VPDRYENSRRMLARARESLAGGVSSPFRARAPVPLYFADGQGPRLRDVDGNEYIDYALAWGPLILGHRHPKLVEAVARQACCPHLYGAQHELEFQVAEKVQAMVPCAERVIFTSSGSEAVQAALRLVRAYTGRDLIIKFEGHYHGWMDSTLWSYHPTPADPEPPAAIPGSRGQVARAADSVLIAPWNDVPYIERLLAENSVAAIITEPVLCNSGCLMPDPSYLARLRSLATGHGALLIFDEVITGFRIATGGAQQRFGVAPDLATFGKAVAGGLPLSVIAGRADVMNLLATGEVVFGGTFNGNPLSLAASQATLDELSRDNGEALRHANRIGEQLQQGFRDAAAEHGIPLAVTGFGAAFSLHFTARAELRTYRDYLHDDQPRLQRFLRAMLDAGIYLLPDGRVYVSAVHTAAEVDETLAAARTVFARMA
jgi:glutamate-1-semialdehyde 2,1-aminomutase